MCKYQDKINFHSEWAYSYCVTVRENCFKMYCIFKKYYDVYHAMWRKGAVTYFVSWSKDCVRDSYPYSYQTWKIHKSSEGLIRKCINS